jgi:polar amino acid transport system substrate-binding protein
MRRFSRTGLAVMAIATAFSITACGEESAKKSATSADGGSKAVAGEHTDDISKGVAVDPAAEKLLPEDVRKTGKLVIADDLTSPPIEFLASDNKTPIGFDVDIMRLIAAKLGLELEIKNVKFDTIIPGLEGGRFDLTVSSMSATPDRLKVLDMIDYFSNGSSIAVQYGNPNKLTTDNLCGKSIAVQSGSVQQIVRLPALSQKTCESQGKPAIKAVSLPNVQNALTQVASRRIDGVFYDTPSLVWADTQQPKTFEVLKPQVTTSDNAVGLQKNSPLTPAVQAALQSIIDSPKYQEALDRWGITAQGIDKATISAAE